MIWLFLISSGLALTVFYLGLFNLAHGSVRSPPLGHFSGLLILPIISFHTLLTWQTPYF